MSTTFRTNPELLAKNLLILLVLLFLSGCGVGSTDRADSTDSGDSGGLFSSPEVTLSSNAKSVNFNESIILNWSSNDVDGCVASGDWSGNKSSSGSEVTIPLITDSQFTLTCSDDSADISFMLDISVGAPSPIGVTAPLPTLTLSANPGSVAQNGSTTLNWNTTNATSCAASGDWDGSKGTSGSETISSLVINSQFSLTCVGSGGSINDTVNVAVVLSQNGTALLSWTPPTLNADDSPLIDLAGYKIYYGMSSDNYSETIIINNSGLSSYLVENLASSTWYFVMTAFNSSGIESVITAEVNKVIN